MYYFDVCIFKLGYKMYLQYIYVYILIENYWLIYKKNEGKNEMFKFVLYRF